MIPVLSAELDAACASASSQDDPRVAAALEEYLERLNAGERPPRDVWLARYPEIAEVLGECLDGLMFVYQASPLAAGARLGPAEDESASRPWWATRIVRELGRGDGVVYEAARSLGIAAR